MPDETETIMLPNDSYVTRNELIALASLSEVGLSLLRNIIACSFERTSYTLEDALKERLIERGFDPHTNIEDEIRALMDTMIGTLLAQYLEKPRQEIAAAESIEQLQEISKRFMKDPDIEAIKALLLFYNEGGRGCDAIELAFQQEKDRT